MSVLASLVCAYDRMAPRGEVPAFGYARTEVEFCIVLRSDGLPAFDPIDFRQFQGKKLVGKRLDLPTPLIQRTSGIASNFLWDKTAYSLGIIERLGQRTEKEHQKFIDFHQTALVDIDDGGAAAFLRFLKWWTPAKFEELGWPAEMKDSNVVFALDTEYKLRFLHEREALQSKWRSLYITEAASTAKCLLTGEVGRIARSHPPIKGVRHAQSSGAFIVSFNATAFTSYDHEEGDNAPVLEAAAFKYTAAVNAFLSNNSRNRVQIGDASTIFWAHASDAAVAAEAESIFRRLFGGIEVATESDKIGDKLKLIVKGVPLAEIEPKLAEGVRFYVLGLSPNMARISIRFWFEDDFGVLTKNYQNYATDMRFEPLPKDRPIATIRSLVLRTAPVRRDRSNQIKFDFNRISPLLSGELFRAILTGGRFPVALLSTLIMRIRADHLLDSLRVSLIKAIVVHTMRIERRLPEEESGLPKEDYLVRSDPDDPNPARRLGRLFAVLERAQLAALGDEINTTIKDKFLGAAAATPQQVFVGLIKLSQHHVKRLRNGHSDATWIKDALHARRVGAGLERDIGRLWASFGDGIPALHSIEEQGIFLVEYYQERFGRKAGAHNDDALEDAAQFDDNEE
jgi:CRISPR-associated protein Csd1